MIADDFNNNIYVTVIPNRELSCSCCFRPFNEGEELIKIIQVKQDLKNMLDIQGSDGNWNVDEYMLGLYNGLILAGICVGLTSNMDLRSRPEKFLSELKTHDNICYEYIEEIGSQLNG